MSALEQLKALTVVVADTGEFDLINEFKPQDATTNPSLITKAASKFPELLQEAIEYAKSHASSADERAQLALDKLSVIIGAKILGVVSGRVSTEIDARLSFDTDATIKRCLKLARLYEEIGVDWKTRVLFKIASTWQGIRAAEVLERFGYRCNLTLLFSFAQAVACAEANVTLISPFVGRILDYYKKETGKSWDATPSDDPGVVSVRAIYEYYKKYDYKTIVMGASFRNINEILELAGCDYLTISPQLLKELADSKAHVVPKLNAADAKKAAVAKVHITEERFNWLQCQDAMATVKLAEGIRTFAADIEKLEALIREKL